MGSLIRGKEGFGPGPEKLIFVVLLGLIAASLMPLLRQREEVARLTVTQGHLTAMAAALEEYFEEHGSYPEVERFSQLKEMLGQEPDNGDLLVPPFRYECWSDAPEDPGCTAFALGSAGFDGRWERDSLLVYETPEGALEYGADMVYRDGEFVQKPPIPEFSWMSRVGIGVMVALVFAGLILLWFFSVLFGF